MVNCCFLYLTEIFCYFDLQYRSTIKIGEITNHLLSEYEEPEKTEIQSNTGTVFSFLYNKKLVPEILCLKIKKVIYCKVIFTSINPFYLE